MRKKLVVHTDECEKAFQRVTEGKRTVLGFFCSSSPKLTYKPDESKEYLLNDILISGVTKIEVTSI